MRFDSGIHYFDTAASAQKYYTKIMDPLCKTWELTHNELDILLFLHNNPEFDRAADIVSRRGIAKSHVSLSVASLEEKGLLVRRFDENDRRAVHLELTEAGRIISAQARDLQLRYFSALYQGISPEEFEIWRKITQKVRDNINNLDTVLE